MIITYNLKISGIYKITNPKGKIYIGSSIHIHRRLLNYKSYQAKEQPKLFNSFNKYGFENHIIEILEECSKENLITREIFWVEKLDTINSGLNIAKPGENKFHQSKTLKFNKDWCNKISLAKKGKSVENVKKPIIQYDLNMNKIQEWESQASASRDLNISSSGINNNLKEISETSGGFIWKYK